MRKIYFTCVLFCIVSFIYIQTPSYADVNKSQTVETVLLGANVTKLSGEKYQTTFALWSPDTSKVQLWLNGKTYPMTNHELYISTDLDSTVYYVSIPKNCSLEPYHFIVNGISVQDPYARMIDLNWKSTDYTQNDIVISSYDVLPVTLTEPKFVNKTDAVIYEANVRDFTVDSNSGVSKGLNGTYTGMIELKTVYTDSTGVLYKTGFDHLKQLGISYIQIMPFYEYGTCTVADMMKNSKEYDWGYDPVNYNVPEWLYSKYNTTISDNGAKLPDLDNIHYLDRIKEVQNMIHQFHVNGMRVIMDVVYNHTFSKDVLGNITDKYYTAKDHSGCGNSLDVSNPMVSRMVLDSLKYWVRKHK